MPSQPTRFPYGIALLKPWSNQGFAGAPQYLVQNSSNTLFATPNITNGSYWIAAQSGTITNFLPNDANMSGYLLYIKCTTGGVVIIQNSAPVIRMNNIVGTTSAGSTVAFTTAGNLTMLNGETLQFVHDGTGWVLVGNRFVLSTQA